MLSAILVFISSLVPIFVGVLAYNVGKRSKQGEIDRQDKEILKKYDKISNENIPKEDVYKEGKW